MIYKTFFAKSRLDPSYKQPAVVTDDDIRCYADSVFVRQPVKDNNPAINNNLLILDDDILSNKRIIIEKGDTLGFAFIVYEPIPCPSCSDVNYELITDKEYIIRSIRYIRDVIEDYKMISEEYINAITFQVIGKNVMRDELTIVIPKKSPKKQTNGFSASIKELQSRVRLLK